MAGIRQSDLREKVQAYFKAQLDQYIDWLDRRGLPKKVLELVREELLDHESFVELDSAATQWLPVERFKRKMDVSDADWEASMPRIALELRKGRRDLLRAVLEAAERQDGWATRNFTFLSSINAAISDTFVFGREASNGIREVDTITDYNVFRDTILLTNNVSIARTIERGSDLVIVLSGGDGDRIVLKNLPDSGPLYSVQFDADYFG